MLHFINAAKAFAMNWIRTIDLLTLFRVMRSLVLTHY